MQTSNGRILSLLIDDHATLWAMWMPFILSGAIFVPDVEEGFLGEEIFLLLRLPGATDRISVAGQVIWVNPSVTASRQGIGVRFGQSDGGARTAIENCLEELPSTGGVEHFV